MEVLKVDIVQVELSGLDAIFGYIQKFTLLEVEEVIITSNLILVYQNGDSVLQPCAVLREFTS